MTAHVLRYARRLALCALFVTLLWTPASGQSREQVKEQVESQLRQMTPEEIERKLKELGLTFEEASRKAQELGISFEELVGKRITEAAAEKEMSGQLQDPRLGFQLAPLHQAAKLDSAKVGLSLLRRARRVDIPGFKGRRGIDSLMQPYGYELFQLPSGAFDPSVNVATPPSYALGAGDELLVTVWGETRLSYRLSVTREGNLIVPEVGPVTASGLNVQQFRERLLRRMSTVYSGLRNGASGANTFLDVSLGKLKTIQVFVVGEVLHPGGYPLMSMSTALNALLIAGGPTAEGSLRNIRVMRRGDTSLVADLYKSMLDGTKGADILLQDGDIILVRPAQRRVAVVGEVVRPAIYELGEGENLGDAIRLAGGLRFSADFKRVHVERVVPFTQRAKYEHDILDLDITSDSYENLTLSTAPLENGDIVTVLAVGTRAENRVYVTGGVMKPGPFELLPGMRIRDLLIAADSLRRNTFTQRGTLFRTLFDLRKEIIPFSPMLALAGHEEENIALRNEDSVVIYADSLFIPPGYVTITGAVRRPGVFPRHEKMTAATLVINAGGLLDGASTIGWEIARMDTITAGKFVKIIKLNPGPIFWRENPTEEEYLLDHDVVQIPFEPRFSLQKLVKISGQVLSPGVYAIRYADERIAELFKRAGGLKQGAYLEGSKLIRKFNNAGVVPLDFKAALNDPDSRDNVVLYEGDSVHVAITEDVVYVTGEVYVPSPVLYKEGAGKNYYVEQAGDYKEEAESGKTVVFLPGGKKWEGGDILPGSTIYVPKRIEKEDRTLPILANIVTIVASLAALSVALIQVTK